MRLPLRTHGKKKGPSSWMKFPKPVISHGFQDSPNTLSKLLVTNNTQMTTNMMASNEDSSSTTPGTFIELHSPFYYFTQALWDWIKYLWDEFEPFITFPVIILFALPVLMLLFVYFSGLLFYFWSMKDKIYKGLRQAIEEHDVYKAAREIVTYLWDFQGWIFYGYEVDGLEHIPKEGAAMLLYYHGVIPIDYYYLVAKVFIQKQRVMHSVVDRFLFKLWGMKTFLKAFNCAPGSQESCSEILENGGLLGLSPGGLFEALFGDENYELLWKQRLGFAKVALNTKCKIIPVFTQNIRETFRTPALGRKLLRPLYNWTRLPIMPIYGGFPVKLKTIVGQPIEYDPEHCTPEELRNICQSHLQKLIDDHQKKPGSICRAFYQRFRSQTSQHQK